MNRQKKTNLLLKLLLSAMGIAIITIGLWPVCRPAGLVALGIWLIYEANNKLRVHHQSDNSED